MKKLMIAFAVVAMAAISEAAVVKWSSGTLNDPADPGEFAVGKGYLYMLTEAQYTSYGDDMAKMYADYQAKSGAFAGNATDSKDISATGSVAGLTDNVSYESGKKVYAALIYEAKGSDGKDYYIANSGVYEAAGTAKTQSNMGTKLHGTGSAIEWTAVPEPTSGLLLLLGVAGLALKRRRA